MYDCTIKIEASTVSGSFVWCVGYVVWPDPGVGRYGSMSSFPDPGIVGCGCYTVPVLGYVDRGYLTRSIVIG